MRLFLARGMMAAFLACSAAFGQQKAARLAGLSGVVQGVEGASVVVHLEVVSDNPTRYYDGYEVISEKDGKFRFEDINPGTYRLTAEASGFMLAGPNGGNHYTLRPGENLHGIRVAMTPRKGLCGRVIGGPKNTWVDAYRYDPEFGALSRTVLVAGNGGSFCFSDLVPGTYFLRNAATWFPDSLSFSDAKPIVVKAGVTEGTFDIPLGSTVCRVTMVSGRIAGTPANDKQKYWVLFMERNSAGGSIQNPVGLQAAIRAGDTFSTLLCPGVYDIVLSDQGTINTWRELPSHKVVFDTIHVVVGEKAVNGIVLTPHAMASITGEVRFEDLTRKASCPRLGGQEVSILREGDGQYQTMPLDEKNHFEFQNVSLGNYSIYFRPFLREAVYVKSIFVDGLPADGRRFSIKEAKSVSVDVTLSGDLTHAAGHVSPDLRRVRRWEVAWTRPKGSVEGKVEGKDLEKIDLTLRSARYNSNASGEYQAHPAPDGTFRFDSVDPGIYTLFAKSEETVPYEYGSRSAGERGTPIIVPRGAKLTGFQIAPPKFSTICGEVTGVNGSPQAGLPIFLKKVFSGYLFHVQKSGEVDTDAGGRFRAEGLMPGDYYLEFPWQNQISFFSSDGALGKANMIRLRPGESAGCGPGPPLEFRVPQDVSERYVVSGQIADDVPAKFGDRFWVSLQWDDPQLQEYVGSAKLDSEHHFAIAKVPDGRFILQLHSAYGPGPKQPVVWSGPYSPVSHLLAIQTIEVHGHDVSGVRIKPMDLPTVTGTVRFDHVPSDWKIFDKSTFQITLVPRAHEQPFSAKLSADGSFSIGPEDVGDYEVRLQLPHSLCIRSVRLNGTEIKGRYFHLPPGASAHLDVDVSGESGRVDATIVPDPSVPLAEPPVREPCGRGDEFVVNGVPLDWPEQQLVLFPDPLFPDQSDPDSSFEPRLIWGARGEYTPRSWLRAEAVPPGRYRALAAQHLTEGFFSGIHHKLSRQERQLWEALAALAQPVTVHPGDKMEIVVPDRSVDVARLMAKYGVPIDKGALQMR